MKIKHYNSFLNETTPREFSFVTVLSKSDIVEYWNVEKEKDDDVEQGETTIEWELDFDNRKAGLNSLGVIIKKVKGFYVVSGDEKEDQKDFEIKADDDKWDLKAEYEGDFRFGSSLYPTAAVIDFKAKKVTVAF